MNNLSDVFNSIVNFYANDTSIYDVSQMFEYNNNSTHFQKELNDVLESIHIDLQEEMSK